jgi:hypothetical protein
MFGIPYQIFWPTAAFASIILLVFGGVVALRYLPRPRSPDGNLPDREALKDLQARLAQLDQLHERVTELEERVDFAERLVAKERDGERLRLPHD